MDCPSCGEANRAGRKFCAGCGTPLARACPSCSAANEPNDRFCGECGTALDSEAPAFALHGEKTERRPEPAAERRLVSVLFADLVGFTTLSEQRDSEEVRELLSRYFETAQRVVARYGGTVEKFIGDAVMAVWGAPAAQEDDAERAVRAALDLVALVSALGEEIGAPRLRLRAGVVTGEAAVTIAAEGQGMVAGDLVNTASRVQSSAEPGTVLVGETTRRATEAAIGYLDAGARELKGKAEPVPLWRAVQVLAGRRGIGRPTGLEPPFVGREGEFRLIKELFHSTADEGKARLVSVIGVAGVGKSRLSWEFEKHIDGLAHDVWWHRGRCLAYGDGVTYWALAEMVRMRARITEDEEPAAALAKLHDTIAAHVPNMEEREWVEPRLAHLLGLADRTAPDREDLFSAWRILFEHMSETAPTVLVFEDLQWADASLLDFIEYLLEWSRNHRLFILTLARPDLADRRPTWGAGGRNFTSLFLEPLPAETMDELLAGFVPGLPDDLRTRICDQAEGIPLYAVETVRMLLDRGLLEQQGEDYRPTRSIDALEVPETLHALVAARLDGLEREERRLVEDASVLGKTFTERALQAVSGLAGHELAPLLASLLRKEVFVVDSDPWSPERGQYGFVQALMQKVAYDTLSKKERKARHLVVAQYLEGSSEWEEDEVVEVVAAHYLDAYRAAPDAPDAAAIKTKARERLQAAGERAASLAANVEAQRYFEHAAALTDDPLSAAELYESAGRMAQGILRAEDARAHFERATALYEEEGRVDRAARAVARLGETLWLLFGEKEEALELLEDAFRVLSAREPGPDLADLAAVIGGFRSLTGDIDLAAERVDLALEIAESLRMPALVARCFNTKAFVRRDRPEEGLALLERALKISLESEEHSVALRAYVNLGYAMMERDRHTDALRYIREGLALSRKRGDRTLERLLLANLVESLQYTGGWEEALVTAAEFGEGHIGYIYLLFSMTRIFLARGDLAAAQDFLERVETPESPDRQDAAVSALGRALVEAAQGRHLEALAAAEEAIAAAREANSSLYLTEGVIAAVEACLALGRLDHGERVIAELEALPPVGRSRYLDAHIARFHARFALERERPAGVAPAFEEAVSRFRELEVPFWLGVTLLEHAEWLVANGRGKVAEPLLADAHEIFAALGAVPWLERLSRIDGAPEAKTAAGALAPA
jgi:class 3 adenylate cyclase/predicted ATPase